MMKVRSGAFFFASVAASHCYRLHSDCEDGLPLSALDVFSPCNGVQTINRWVNVYLMEYAELCFTNGLQGINFIGSVTE